MEESKPIITVVVTTYQHERYIAQCLDGVLMQRGDFRLQLLVVDDASTDSTPEIISDYARRYPDIIEPVLLQENIFKTGRKTQDVIMPKVKGEFFAVCEGDDYWINPNKLNIQVKFLITHPKHTACFHLHEVKNETSINSPFVPKMRRERDVTPRELILEHLAHTNSMLFRTSVFWGRPEYWEIYHKVYPYTDILTFAEAALKGKVHGFPGKWSVYRLHGEGICTQRKLEASALDSSYFCERKLINEFYGENSDMQQWVTLYEQLEQWTLMRRSGHTVQAVKQLLRAFIYNPRRFLRLYYSRYFL